MCISVASAESGIVQRMSDRWNNPEASERISPRECVYNAQKEINQAWCSADYNEAVIFLRGGIDWLRRALEQMA